MNKLNLVKFFIVMIFLVPIFIKSHEALANEKAVKKSKISKSEKIKLKRDLSESDWFKSFRPGFIEVACSDKSFFRSCYFSDLKECQSKLSESAIYCRNKLNPPKSFKTNLEVEKFGFKLGVCVGKVIEKKNFIVFSRDQKCKDSKAW